MFYPRLLGWCLLTLAYCSYVAIGWFWLVISPQAFDGTSLSITSFSFSGCFGRRIDHWACLTEALSKVSVMDLHAIRRSTPTRRDGFPPFPSISPLRFPLRGRNYFLYFVVLFTFSIPFCENKLKSIGIHRCLPFLISRYRHASSCTLDSTADIWK